MARSPKMKGNVCGKRLGRLEEYGKNPVCRGRFNVILSQRERNRQGRITATMRRFAQVIDELGLVDLPLQGGGYTWSGGLIISLGLEGGAIRRGLSPFRFENMWLKVEGFKDLIHSWWQGIEILDASLIANEVIDAWQKREEKGPHLGCGKEILFLLTSLSWGMEVLSTLIRRAVEGGFLSAPRQGLRINLDKSEIIPSWRGGRDGGDGSRIGLQGGLYAFYVFGAALGAPNKAASMWDGWKRR
ncbi:hypothetical protein CK203_100656 [Vitis vinifera]|uniref:Uncharacterized protein n=1 Tax=Vitis vinifera TaxID=29760 RepID=A0A438D657_VITVI|nr:hypothetical protein CK203_100656 [Vitis vinifera]